MRIVWSVLLVLMLVPGWAGYSRLPLPQDSSVITARPVALDANDPARRRVGRLTWLGGVALDSDDPAWGGYSAMTVRGDRFTLLSDGGVVARFRMGNDWRVRGSSLAALPAGPGTGWLKEDRDSESLAVDPASGRAWIGFERANEIWRFDAGLRHWQRRARPFAMRNWPDAGGAEAMARMPDGGFVALAEQEGPGRGRRHGLRFARDPTEAPNRGFAFTYVPPARYEPSDAVALPDGRLLVLNRRFRLPFDFSAKLVMIDAGAIRPGVLVRGREIATLAAPLVHDNFEALTVTQEGADTIVWIASDDNQAILERTLLLKFRLDPDA